MLTEIIRIKLDKLYSELDKLSRENDVSDLDTLEEISIKCEDFLSILAESAKYDASCSSSGSNRKNEGGMGNGHISGICHSFTSNGRCVSLLKILMTNACMYDCKYCINRKSNNIKRAILTPEEIANLTINFYKRNYIEGLFLSSAIIKDADYTMKLMIEAIYLLRNKYKFNGYIHTKCIPGSSKYLIDELGKLSDRMSANIELPSNNNLKLLAPDKKSNNIFGAMSEIKNERENNRKFVPAGQSTQMIIGASDDSDYQIINLTEGLYNKFDLKRVYYSAYVPVNVDRNLPAIKTPPLKRENRLYQADWLLRFYGFKANELLTPKNPNFNLLIDPKANYALNNIDNYPIEINTADYKDILRVPGIGVTSAKRIMMTRKVAHLDFDTLKRIGVVLKRAKYFITCDGKYYSKTGVFKKDIIYRQILLEGNIKQLSLFHDE